MSESSNARVEIGHMAIEYLRDSVAFYENGELKLMLMQGEADILLELLTKLKSARQERSGDGK